MYQLESAKARIANSNGAYSEVDIKDVPLNTVMDTYEKIYAQLTHTVVDGEFTLNLENIPVVVKESSMTLPEYLVENGSNELPLEDGPIDFETKYCHFYDGWSSGFTAKTMSRDYHHEAVIADALKVDLFITKEDANFVNLAKYCLFTVNGFVHYGDSLYDGVMVNRGGLSAKTKDEYNFGIIDFQHIGELDIVPITEEMVVTRHDQQLLSDMVHIVLPAPVGGKKPFLVLGGYLHALDGLYRMVSDTVMAFDFYRYPWARRYFLARDYIDLSALGSLENDKGGTLTSLLYSDDTIRKWFSLEQSFIVLIDTDDVYTSTMELTYGNLPGVYTTAAKPNKPLLLGDGRVAEYKRSNQRGVWVTKTTGYLQDNPIRETGEFMEQETINNHRNPIKPTSPAIARHLIISKTVEVDDGDDVT